MSHHYVDSSQACQSSKFDEQVNRDFDEVKRLLEYIYNLRSIDKVRLL